MKYFQIEKIRQATKTADFHAKQASRRILHTAFDAKKGVLLGLRAKGLKHAGQAVSRILFLRLRVGLVL